MAAVVNNSKVKSELEQKPKGLGSQIQGLQSRKEK